MRVPPLETKCIGQASYRSLTKKEIIQLIEETYSDMSDNDGNVCIVTTAKSGDTKDPVFSQSVMFNRVLGERDRSPL